MSDTCGVYFPGNYGGPSGGLCERPISSDEPHEHRGIWMGLPISAPYFDGVDPVIEEAVHKWVTEDTRE